MMQGVCIDISYWVGLGVLNSLSAASFSTGAAVVIQRLRFDATGSTMTRTHEVSAGVVFGCALRKSGHKLAVAASFICWLHRADSWCECDRVSTNSHPEGDNSQPRSGGDGVNLEKAALEQMVDNNLRLLFWRGQFHILATGSTQKLKERELHTLALLVGFSTGILRSAFRLAIRVSGARQVCGGLRGLQYKINRRCSKRWGETHQKNDYLFDRRVAGTSIQGKHS